MPQNDQFVAESHIELEERIRERAHQIWQRRERSGEGDQNNSLDDWLQAEREILGGSDAIAAQNRGTTVGDAHTPDRTRIEELGEA